MNEIFNSTGSGSKILVWMLIRPYQMTEKKQDTGFTTKALK